MPPQQEDQGFGRYASVKDDAVCCHAETFGAFDMLVQSSETDLPRLPKSDHLLRFPSLVLVDPRSAGLLQRGEGHNSEWLSSSCWWFAHKSRPFLVVEALLKLWGQQDGHDLKSDKSFRAACAV